jgi:hypothetical protein
MLATDDVRPPTDHRVAANTGWMAAGAAIAILQGVAVAFPGGIQPLGDLGDF